MTTNIELNAYWLINNFSQIKLKDCGSNGDCFYLSLIYYLKLDIKPNEIRQQIAQYITERMDHYSQFFENKLKLEQEIKDIKNKKWADNLSISVVTKLYKLNICIIYKHDRIYKFHNITYNSTINNNVYLYYNGTKYNGEVFEFGTGHYKAIDNYTEK